MNPTIKRYLISSTITFLTAFFGTLAIQLNAGFPPVVNVAFVVAILSSAARAGVKALVEWVATQNADDPAITSPTA